MVPVFFADQGLWRKWLQKHHAANTELLVGFYKKDSGKPSIDWNQSVDEALCFGWMDGVRKSIDGTSYTIRFTPRKPGGIWSAKNLKRAGELIEAGLMHPHGKAVFEGRKQGNTNQYSFEQKTVSLVAYEKAFRKNRQAWANFQAMGAYYVKVATWWVISAKQEATRLRRLETLIGDSQAGLKVAPLRPRGKMK